MALGVKSHGLGDFTNGKRRTGQKAHSLLQAVFNQVAVRRIAHGGLKAAKAFGFADVRAFRQLPKGYIFGIVYFDIMQEAAHTLERYAALRCFRDIEVLRQLQPKRAEQDLSLIHISEPTRRS